MSGQKKGMGIDQREFWRIVPRFVFEVSSRRNGNIMHRKKP